MKEASKMNGQLVMVCQRIKDDNLSDKGWPGLCMGHQEKYLIYGKVRF